MVCTNSKIRCWGYANFSFFGKNIAHCKPYFKKLAVEVYILQRGRDKKKSKILEDSAISCNILQEAARSCMFLKDVVSLWKILQGNW